MRLVGYCRVSTTEQAESGNGLEAQRAACEAYAASQGATIAAWYEDAGVSGRSSIDKRPGLLDAIAELGKGGQLVVAKRDRLSRDPIVGAMAESAAKRKGARIVSAAGEGTEDDGPTSVLMRRMVDAFAEYEALVIAARTKAALRAKARRGERVGQIPFGYRLADDGVQLVEHEGEQRALTLIRDLRAGGMSYRAIVAELGVRGVRPRGKRWHETTVGRLLTRDAA